MDNNLYQECLGNQLYRIRVERRIRQSDLSDLTGLSRGTIRAVENGQGNLSSFGALIDALGLEIHCSRRSTGAHIGEHITCLRKKDKISQRAFAEAVDVSHPTIIKLEKYGQGRLSTLRRALSVLGATPRLICRTEMNGFHYVSKSRVTDEWHTPASLLSNLTDAIGAGFDLDPCSPTLNPDEAPVVASRYYTVQQDGLSMKWAGRVYMNPPYSMVKKWVEKARLAIEQKDADLVIGLVPARTDTKWWNASVAGYADVFFLHGRLTFSGHHNTAPFPSAVVVWGGDGGLIERLAGLLKAHHMPRNTPY